MILSDNDIRKRLEYRSDRLVITPLEPGQIQPASVDLTLADECLRTVFNPSINGMSHVHWSDGYFNLQPGEFALGTTVERVEMPLDLVGQVDGKSTLGRLGLGVHITAGYIDPGFKGQITLEFVNHSRVPIKLTPGMKICQLVLHQMLSPASAPYGDVKFGSHYQDQKGVTKSHGLEDLR